MSVRYSAQIRQFSLSERHKLLLRFGTSAIVNTSTYAIVFAIAAYMFGCSAFVSSGVGYTAGLMVGFTMHRRYTFRANGNVFRELFRYLVAQAFTMALVMAMSRVTADVLGWPTWLVILSGMAFAPILNFASMYLWVFTSRRYGTRA